MLSSFIASAFYFTFFTLIIYTDCEPLSVDIESDYDTHIPPSEEKKIIPPDSRLWPDSKDSRSQDSLSSDWITYNEALAKGIIPDVVDKFKKNVTGVFVRWDNGSAFLGNQISPYDIQKEPFVDWFCKKYTWFTVLMIDPDSPKRRAPAWKEWLHWLVVNIPQNHFDEGEVLAKYVPPCPEKDTGIHRYIILLFQQPRKLNFTERYLHTGDLKGRRNFCTRDFAAKYDFRIPVGGNYVLSEYQTKEDRLKSLEENKLPEYNFTLEPYELNTDRNRNWDYNQDTT